jgi:hypothetical protein
MPVIQGPRRCNLHVQRAAGYAASAHQIVLLAATTIASPLVTAFVELE